MNFLNISQMWNTSHPIDIKCGCYLSRVCESLHLVKLKMIPKIKYEYLPKKVPNMTKMHNISTKPMTSQLFSPSVLL